MHLALPRAVPLLLALLLALPSMPLAADAPFLPAPETMAEDALNLYCLRQAYPELRCLEADSAGREWLVFADGRRVLYRKGNRPEAAPDAATPGDGDVAASMADPYPLEPQRPPTPAGVAPGRLRSYALLGALYGEDRQSVTQGLCAVPWPGRPVRLSEPAAAALKRVAQRLAAVVAARPDLRPYLTSEGGFLWRRVAGEERLSPHAFGIAVDLNARHGPYWRWSQARPHPRQRDYPPEIVGAFEAEGFIWGGKWHEYDLMHFEYRPELICKARLRQKAGNNQ